MCIWMCIHCYTHIKYVYNNNATSVVYVIASKNGRPGDFRNWIQPGRGNIAGSRRAALILSARFVLFFINFLSLEYILCGVHDVPLYIHTSDKNTCDLYLYILSADGRKMSCSSRRPPLPLNIIYIYRAWRVSPSNDSNPWVRVGFKWSGYGWVGGW